MSLWTENTLVLSRFGLILKDKLDFWGTFCEKLGIPSRTWLLLLMELTEKQVVGNLGEKISANFLVAKGYSIIAKNYRKKLGEIDIVAKKKEKIHFVEVKTVSRDNLLNPIHKEMDAFRPEDNVHGWKQKRLARAIQCYIAQNKLGETEWQFDVITVFLDRKNKLARVKVLENIIL